jgi:hypothetical protein
MVILPPALFSVYRKLLSSQNLKISAYDYLEKYYGVQLKEKAA